MRPSPCWSSTTPVNALSPAVIDRIAAAVDQFLADETFSALLVHCAGSTFVAGADISIFDEPDFTTVHVGAFGDPGSSAELDKFLDPSTLGL